MAIMSFLKNLQRTSADIRQQVLESHQPLWQAYRQHQFIYVMIKGEEALFQSMILDIDTQHGQLLIDELFPRDMSAVPGQRVSVFVKAEEGRSFQFNTYVIAKQAEDNSEIYTLRLPEEVSNHQRREAYRLLIDTGTQGSHLVISPDDTRRFLANINDLSTTGVGLRIEGDTLEETPVGMTFNSRIDLVGLNMDCQLGVRRVQMLGENEPVTTIGSEFIDLNMSQQRVLSRYIMASQRRTRQV